MNDGVLVQIDMALYENSLDAMIANTCWILNSRNNIIKHFNHMKMQ